MFYVNYFAFLFLHKTRFNDFNFYVIIEKTIEIQKKNEC